MEDAADRGDVGGVLGHAAGSAAPYVAPLGIDGVARGAAAAARPVGRGITSVASAVDPDVVGLASPRMAHAQRLGLKIGNALGRIGKAPEPPAMDALSEAAPNEIDALSEAASQPQIVHYPDQGFLPPTSRLLRYPSIERPPTKPTPPFQPITPAKLTGYIDPLEMETPYRLGPGQVPSDDVGAPNPNVLAGNKGIIVRKPLQLKAGTPGFRSITPDALDDRMVAEGINDKVALEERNLRRDASREWYDNNSPAVPKWKQVAQIRAELAAQKEMEAAEAAQAIPARLTKTRPPRSETAKAQLGTPQPTPDDQLLPKLEESVRQAREKRARQKGESR